ncbi:hypothetical protein R6Q59_016448 [Mikania micrantha]
MIFQLAHMVLSNHKIQTDNQFTFLGIPRQCNLMWQHHDYGLCVASLHVNLSFGGISLILTLFCREITGRLEDCLGLQPGYIDVFSLSQMLFSSIEKDTN